MKNDIREAEVIFRGKLMKLSEAGALFLKIVIEEEIPKSPGYPANVDPYKWLSLQLRRSPEVVRRWTYPWKSNSGAMPTIDTFLRILHMTGTPYIYEFIECIVKGTEEVVNENTRVLRFIAQSLGNVVDLCNDIASNYSEAIKSNRI